jgi:hypothetical protein
MAYVYHIRTKNITSTDDGYIGVTGTNKKNKTPQQRLQEHCKSGRFVSYGQKEDLIVDVLFEGTDDFCFSKEKELRPVERMGWNISPGGEGGFKGNHYVSKHGINWRDKINETRNKKLKSGKIKIWCKGKKLTGKNYDSVVANRKDKLPWEYEVLNQKTNKIYKVIGYNELIKLINMSKSSITKISNGKKVKGCPFVLLSKNTRKYSSVGSN